MLRIFISLFILYFPHTNFAETIRVEGLQKPAEIIVDTLGIPHIYAQEHYDAFFVQGFNAARDRLWQIDVWRRRGLGELSAAFGKQYIQQDRANRLFLYRGDMYREWLSYGSDAKKIATAFANGVNAYIDYLDAKPEKLPIEFSILNYSPAKWNAEDIIRIRSHGLWRNVSSELNRALILCDHGKAAANLWKKLEPSWDAIIPSGFNACDFNPDILDVYELAKQPVRFDENSQYSSQLSNTWVQESLGSNNWVVAPSRSASNSAILANDPHRGHAVPSLRYIAHLNAPGINVIGAGEPGLPGISIGHNENIAFGLTIFAIDQEDLYYYEINPLKPDVYQYQQHDEEILSFNEVIKVRDADPVTVTLEFTRHGPIVKREKNRIYAVRAAWLEPGMAPYFGSVEYMRAKNWREFISALNRWGAPAENQVYADINGNIGYKPAGLFPRRNNFDGLLPVSGHGAYEWEGFFDMDVLPVQYNPAKGFIHTANAMNLPSDYPIDLYRVGFEWSAPWRHRRIEEILNQQKNHTFSDSIVLQRDYQSVLARQMVNFLPKNIPNEAKKLFENWNGKMDLESSAAALYVVWYYRHLVPTLIESLFGSTSIIKTLDTYSVLDLIQKNKYQSLINETLIKAIVECRQLMGEKINRWRWGDLHQIQFIHPLLNQTSNSIQEIMKFKSYPRGGTGNTTNNTGFSPDDFLVRSGASWRFVVDTQDWDNARMTSAPGQSGDPRSKYYDNLLEGWANEKSFPLYFSRESVDKNTDFTIHLIPK